MDRNWLLVTMFCSFSKFAMHASWASIAEFDRLEVCFELDKKSCWFRGCMSSAWQSRAVSGRQMRSGRARWCLLAEILRMVFLKKASEAVYTAKSQLVQLHREARASVEFR